MWPCMVGLWVKAGVLVTLAIVTCGQCEVFPKGGYGAKAYSLKAVPMKRNGTVNLPSDGLGNN